MPMTIRFIKNYGRHKAGDVRVVEDAHAADFIERGFAVDTTPEPEPEPIQEVAPPPVLGVAPDEVEID